MRQARIILADARRYRKPKARPKWSPIYGQLVDAALAVEAEVKRAKKLAAREQRAASAKPAAAPEE